jgi:hypothetical protein
LTKTGIKTPKKVQEKGSLEAGETQDSAIPSPRNVFGQENAFSFKPEYVSRRGRERFGTIFLSFDARLRNAREEVAHDYKDPIEFTTVLNSKARFLPGKKYSLFHFEQNNREVLHKQIHYLFILRPRAIILIQLDFSCLVFDSTEISRNHRCRTMVLQIRHGAKGKNIT